MRVFLGGLALAMGALWQQPVGNGSAPTAAHKWVTYKDPQGYYMQCYPADLLKPKAGSEDLALVGPHHESADEGVQSGSLQDALRKDTDNFDQADGQTTYVKKTATWFVFSGVDKLGVDTEAGGTIYERGVLSGDHVVTLQLRYPKAEAAVFDPVAAAMGRCLVALAKTKQP